MVDALLKCELFNRLNRLQIEVVLDETPHTTQSYHKGQLIASEGEECEKIGIVLSGEISMQNLLHNGATSVIGRFNAGKLFGEVLIFGKESEYPATIIAESNAEILYFNNKDFLYMIKRNDLVFENLLSLMTNRIYYLNSRIKMMNQHCLRSKICFYLYNQFKHVGNEKIQLRMSKQQFAEYIGVARPSLSRELINMREEGLISFDRKTITILDLEAVEKYID